MREAENETKMGGRGKMREANKDTMREDKEDNMM